MTAYYLIRTGTDGAILELGEGGDRICPDLPMSERGLKILAASWPAPEATRRAIAARLWAFIVPGKHHMFDLVKQEELVPFMQRGAHFVDTLCFVGQDAAQAARLKAMNDYAAGIRTREWQ